MRSLFFTVLPLSIALVVACQSGDPGTAKQNTRVEGSSEVATKPTPASDIVDGRYVIGSATSAKECLAEIADNKVGKAACDGDDGTQRWTIVSLGDGVFKIVSGASGNSLDVTGGGTESGTTVGTWPYGDGSDNRKFRIADAGDGAVEFQAIGADGMCLALADDGGAELAKCGTKPTRWFLYRVKQASSIGRGLDSAGCVAKPKLAVAPADVANLSELAKPLDTNAEDLEGPDSWNGNYGRRPVFAAVPNGSGFDVLYENTAKGHRGAVVHFEPEGDGFAAKNAWSVGLLDRIMGYAVGDDGIRYYASAVDEGEKIDVSYPPNDVHRANIVRVVGFDESGCVRVDVDVDLARGYLDAGSAILINPMTAGSSRLTFGGGLLSLVHAANTQPDDNGTRHQMSRATYLDVKTGEAVRASTMWVSHSFDIRQIWDGERFLELHLGDTYPRGVVLGRFGADDGNGGYLPFRAKGDGNPTYTRLGGVAPIGSGDYGWLTVFSTERSGEVTDPRGARDLALVRVVRNFDELDGEKDVIIDESAPEQLATSAGTPVENHLTWLTDYGKTASASDAAERPRVVPLGDDKFLLLFEHWVGDEFDATFGLTVDGTGKVVSEPKKIGTDHIPRGDDAIAVGGKGILVSGAGGKLLVTVIGADLTTKRYEIP